MTSSLAMIESSPDTVRSPDDVVAPVLATSGLQSQPYARAGEFLTPDILPAQQDGFSALNAPRTPACRHGKGLR
jgi:hypothetical protein